jgi:hypothetical protein
VAYFLWYAVGLIISTIPGAGVLYVVVYSFMWVLVPITAVQLSYGMAATCFPMLPTCLLQVGGQKSLHCACAISMTYLIWCLCLFDVVFAS